MFKLRKVINLSLLLFFALFLFSCENNEEKARKIPISVLVELMSFLDNEVLEGNLDAPTKQFYNYELNNIKSRIMKHELTLEGTKEYLNYLVNSNYSELAKKTRSISEKLITREDLKKRWESVYGRVFNSAVVKELVRNPPEDVLTAMTLLGQGLGELLEREILRIPNLELLLESKLYKLLVEVDPRFWFPKVPVLYNIQQNGPRNSVRNLIGYLKSEKITIIEAMSIPFLIVKVGLILKDLKRTPKYLTQADFAYAKLYLMIKGVRINVPNPPYILTRSGGITLASQYPIIQEDWMVLSQKPTDVRKPRLTPTTGKNAALEQASFALFNWLKHGVVWASGMSGSTNVDMQAWHWLNYNSVPEIQKTIDKNAAFLGIMMFLVYDGGHSIAEVLWAANSVDKKLELGFSLTDSDRIDEFLPNFYKFIAIYKGTAMEKHIVDAFDNAFKVTVDYFRKYESM